MCASDWILHRSFSRDNPCGPCGAALQLDPETIYDIFDNLTDVQTVMWRDAVYAFRRRREGEPCPLTLEVNDDDDGDY